MGPLRRLFFYAFFSGRRGPQDTRKGNARDIERKAINGQNNSKRRVL